MSKVIKFYLSAPYLRRLAESMKPLNMGARIADVIRRVEAAKEREREAKRIKLVVDNEKEP